MRHPNLKEILKEIKEYFPENHNKIYLYGSQSRNEAKESSDIDLLVFCRKISKEIREILKEMSKKYEVDINHQYCTHRCLNTSHLVFWKTVKKDANPIDKFV